MNISKELKEFAVLLSIALFMALAFSFVLFGITGARVVLGVVFVSLPFYFMLNNFELEESEKIVFSILLGLTILPSFVYLLGFVFSFRISIGIVFVILVIIAFISKKYKSKK